MGQTQINSVVLSQNPYINIDREYGTKKKAKDNGNVDYIWHRFNATAGSLQECTPFVRAFASKVTPGAVLFAELKCGSWECKHCGPRLKFKWYSKQMPKILESSYIEQKEIPAEMWETFRKKLQRAKAKYMTYDRDNGNILVFINAAIGGEPIPNTQEARNEALIKAIESTPFRRQPISQSRNWDPAPTIATTVVKEEEESRWKPLDTAKFNTLEEVATALETMGYQSYNYDLDTRLFGSEHGLITILKPEEYFKVLWTLGVMCREMGEKRVRGFPVEKAA